jgi:hypothetical protein
MDRLFRLGYLGHILDGELAERLVKRETGPGGLFELMGVDGIVLGKDWASHSAFLERVGWRVVQDARMEVLLHRQGPPLPVARAISRIEWASNDDEIVAKILDRKDTPAPAVMLRPKPLEQGVDRLQTTPSSFSRVDVSSIVESRLSVRCQVSNPSQKERGVVLFSRAWYPGYRAFLDGKEIEVHSVNGLQPAVFIAPGARGTLALEFAPKSVRYGLFAACGAAGLAVVFPAGFECARRRRRVPN